MLSSLAQRLSRCPFRFLLFQDVLHVLALARPRLRACVRDFNARAEFDDRD